MATYTIVSINRNTEATCECGSICEKVSYNVVNELGDSFTYGSSCIKSVLGMDVSEHEKRGVQYVNLDVLKYYPDTKNYYTKFKELVHTGGNHYEVKFKHVYLIKGDLNISKDGKTIFYKVKANKKQLKQINLEQGLEIGALFTEEEVLNLSK